MKTYRGPSGRVLAASFGLFCAGIVVGWSLRAGPPAPSIPFDTDTANNEDNASVAAAPPSDGAPALVPAPDTLSGNRTPPPVISTIGSSSSLDELHHRQLRLPLDGVDVESFKGSFAERRDGRFHDAADMLSPRNTPVHAVEDGTIAKLFLSKAGGNTIYQYDPSGRFCYYYAHLDRYADGLRKGGHVSRGDVIGFVGTSGNAPPNTPHLHFAVFELNDDRHWWQGKPLDPYQIFQH